MCDMTNCKADPARYVVIGMPKGTKRLELCIPHVELAHQLAEADLTKIIEYGPLDKRWTVHPGGKS